MRIYSIAIALAAATVLFLTTMQGANAAIKTCDIHNGMHIWYLDYAESDYSLSHPRGVREGIVTINESKWKEKCSADGPYTKVYVPFDPVSGSDKGQMDSRWPQDVYKTRSAALSAFNRR